jgi:predicted dehydrogenase
LSGLDLVVATISAVVTGRGIPRGGARTVRSGPAASGRGVEAAHASGALGVIDNCRQTAYGYDQRAEVLGSEGAVMVSNEELDRTTLITSDGARNATPKLWFTDRYADAYAAEMQAFVDAVRGGHPPEVGGEDGRAPVAIALAAQRSSLEGRPVLVSSVEPPRRQFHALP